MRHDWRKSYISTKHLKAAHTYQSASSITPKSEGGTSRIASNVTRSSTSRYLHAAQRCGLRPLKEWSFRHHAFIFIVCQYISVLSIHSELSICLKPFKTIYVISIIFHILLALSIYFIFKKNIIYFQSLQLLPISFNFFHYLNT